MPTLFTIPLILGDLANDNMQIDLRRIGAMNVKTKRCTSQDARADVFKPACRRDFFNTRYQSRPRIPAWKKGMNVSLPPRAAKFPTMHCKFISFSMHYFF
jgi:hypothetical protein